MSILALAPLSDITNVRRAQLNIMTGCNALSPSLGRSSCDSFSLSPEAISPPHNHVDLAPFTASTTIHVTRTTHNPYDWKCLPDSETQAAILLAQRAQDAAHRATMRRAHSQSITASVSISAVVRPTVTEPTLVATPVAASQTPLNPIRCLVQFKCHHAEYSSNLAVEKGQYVAVQGDRGMDIGVVIRVNDGDNKTFIERTGPCGSIMRHATQREVDYWASELKQDEANALDFCRRRCGALDLQMDVRYAEFQYDKKKLTFYYDAKSRVNFVDLLKDLYREFGCRIWMEKVRPQTE